MEWCQLAPEDCPVFQIDPPHCGYEFFPPTPEGRKACLEDAQRLGTKAHLGKIMPEVIGQDDSLSKRTTCNNCGAKLRYWPREVKRRDGTDYGGGPSGAEWIECPRCNNKVILRSW